MEWQEWNDLAASDLSYEDEVDAWCASGLRTLEVYLARHAAFDTWCRDQYRRYGASGEPGPRAT
jgi:hypothetical protein